MENMQYAYFPILFECQLLTFLSGHKKLIIIIHVDICHPFVLKTVCIAFKLYETKVRFSNKKYLVIYGK